MAFFLLVFSGGWFPYFELLYPQLLLNNSPNCVIKYRREGYASLDRNLLIGYSAASLENRINKG